MNKQQTKPVVTEEKPPNWPSKKEGQPSGKKRDNSTPKSTKIGN